CFGEPLKRINAWVEPSQVTHGDIVITHYGLERGDIYKLGRALREQQKQGKSLNLFLDLLPDVELTQLVKKLQASKKQSLTNIWRKA
ncbi:NAD(P)/FAD-dependent oxidoreductase, partial [Vibrio cholerae]|uniref:NAD(P)/FAD-dependent oxidoreductase n=1 Tax=Vibrio cholerae TaxID=666 RepID=UPI0031F51100